MSYFGQYLYVGPIISKTIAFLYTYLHYNIVGNDVKVMSRKCYGRGVKGQGHRYIRNMKMYKIVYVLAIISKNIDILYIHVHVYSDIVGIDARMTFSRS